MEKKMVVVTGYKRGANCEELRIMVFGVCEVPSRARHLGEAARAPLKHRVSRRSLLPYIKSHTNFEIQHQNAALSSKTF